MIYNLKELLKNQFPAERFYVNERILISGDHKIPDRNVLLIENSGTITPITKLKEIPVQILVRDKETVKARKLAEDIFNYLHDRYGLILPDVTIDGVLYPEIQTAQITAIQTPYWLGADSEGRSEYTTNYMIHFKET